MVLEPWTVMLVWSVVHGCDDDVSSHGMRRHICWTVLREDRITEPMLVIELKQFPVGRKEQAKAARGGLDDGPNATKLNQIGCESGPRQSFTEHLTKHSTSGTSCVGRSPILLVDIVNTAERFRP